MDCKEQSKVLRQACKTGNWNKCRNETLIMFHQMPKINIAEIALKFVKKYHVIFNETYPQVKWARMKLLQIEQAIQDNTLDNWESWFPEQNFHFDTPGDNNFRSSIEELSRMMEEWNNKQKVTELARDAVANVIMATSINHWGNKHPDLWSRLMNPQSDNDRLILSIYFRPDISVKQFEIKLWIQFADAIANWVNNNE